ncbi:MAG TPA: DNA polymerase III subunit delta [Candidatus Gastranaerophilales bacterium]|nr:DNA polymerase III subunit delta [Candidatus Gastranaerophilales bacterium]
MPVYIYWGEEEFNLDNAVKELRKKVLDQNFSALNHRILNEPDLKILVEATQTLPMMLGNLLIEVRTSTLFFRGKRAVSTTDPLMQKLSDNIEKLDKRIHLLFVCPVERESAKKIDSAMKLVKTIQKTGEIVEFPMFKYYEDAKIISWITNQASQKSLKISRDAAISLLQDIGADLRKIDLELEKISVAMHPRKAITINDVKEVVSTSENVFLFADYWLKQDKAQALFELHKLFEKNNPVKIAATLQTVTRRWLKIKLEAKSKKAYDIAKSINLPAFVVEKEMEKLKKIPEERLFLLRENLKKAEYKMKSGGLLPETAMELLVLS